MIHANVMSSMFRPLSEDENNSWLKRQVDSLPSYYDFCTRVHMDLYEVCKVKGYNTLNKAVWLLLWPSIYLFPVGHLFAEIGVVYWFVVIEKYVIFLCVCTGFWTENCVEGYNIEN